MSLVETLLDHPDNLLNRLNLSGTREGALRDEHIEVLHVETKMGGRGRKGTPVNKVEKIVAGVGANLSGTLSTAKEMGLHPSTVTQYKKGEIRHRHDAEVKKGVTSALGQIQEKAADRIMAALECITNDRLDAGAKKDVRVASGVARDMATIIDKTTPKTGDDNRVQVLVYNPVERTEEQYRSIEIPLVVKER